MGPKVGSPVEFEDAVDNAVSTTLLTVDSELIQSVSLNLVNWYTTLSLNGAWDLWRLKSIQVSQM